jgi:methionine-rich copper-binding protein CopC
MKATKRAPAAFLLFGCLLLAPASARAQEMYDTSIPAPGDLLKEAPTPMVITFSEGIYLTNIRLVGADGAVWPTGWQKTEEDIFKVEFKAAKSLPPGKYQIEWTAYIRQHYHPDGGVIMFTIDPQVSTDKNAAIAQEATPPKVVVPPAFRGWPYRGLRAASAPPAGR